MKRIEVVKALKKRISHDLAEFKIYEVPDGWGTRLKLVENEPVGSLAGWDANCNNGHLLWEGNVYRFARELPALRTRVWYPNEEPSIIEISAEEFPYTQRHHRKFRRRVRSKE